MDTPGGQHGLDPVAPRHRFRDDPAVVCRPGYNGHAPRERIEFRDALLTAHAGHFIAAVQRVRHHVLSELPGGSHDADLHHTYLSRSPEPSTVELEVLFLNQKHGQVLTAAGKQVRIHAGSA